MKKSQILILVLCLILVEHLLLLIAYSVWESNIREKAFLIFLSDLISSKFEIRSMVGIFVLRLIFWTIPLYLIFSNIIGKVRIKNIFFFAIVNDLSNFLIIAVYSVILFPGLIMLPATNYTLVITFISPFILYLFPFFRQYVQAFDIVAQDERKLGWNTDD